MRRRLVVWVAITVVLVAAGTLAWYIRDMRRAYQRTRGASEVVSSAFGDIEYTEGGGGPAVLVIHGSGGGLDQGELLARAVLGDEFRWLAPSRFGYLRSTFRAGATFDDQAHAYAVLLDHLRIDRVAVVALSHGGPSALLFAVLHPDRVSSLTLISAGVAPSVDANQAQANQRGGALTWVFQRDYRYWAVTTAFRRRFLGLMGVSDAVIAGLTEEQRELADRVVEFMNPVSQRSAGVRFDNQAAMPNERIAAIRAPTLILHAKDDGLQLYRNAEFAAATIRGARLIGFERGGHLLLAVEQPTIQREIGRHILAHVGHGMALAR